MSLLLIVFCFGKQKWPKGKLSIMANKNKFRNPVIYSIHMQPLRLKIQHPLLTSPVRPSSTTVIKIFNFKKWFHKIIIHGVFIENVFDIPFLFRRGTSIREKAKVHIKLEN